MTFYPISNFDYRDIHYHEYPNFGFEIPPGLHSLAVLTNNMAALREWTFNNSANACQTCDSLKNTLISTAVPIVFKIQIANIFMKSIQFSFATLAPADNELIPCFDFSFSEIASEYDNWKTKKINLYLRLQKKIRIIFNILEIEQKKIFKSHFQQVFSAFLDDSEIYKDFRKIFKESFSTNYKITDEDLLGLANNENELFEFMDHFLSEIPMNIDEEKILGKRHIFDENYYPRECLPKRRQPYNEEFFVVTSSPLVEDGSSIHEKKYIDLTLNSFDSIYSFMKNKNSIAKSLFTPLSTLNNIEQIVSSMKNIILCTKQMFILLKDGKNQLFNFSTRAPGSANICELIKKNFTLYYPCMNAFMIKHGSHQIHFLLVVFDYQINLYKLTTENEIEFMCSCEVKDSLFTSQVEICDNIPYIICSTNKRTILIFTLKSLNGVYQILQKEEVLIKQANAYSLCTHKIKQDHFIFFSCFWGFKRMNLRTYEISDLFFEKSSIRIISRHIKANGNYVCYTNKTSSNLPERIDAVMVYDFNKQAFLKPFIFENKNIKDIQIITSEDMNNNSAQSAFLIVLFENELKIVDILSREDKTIAILGAIQAKQLLIESGSIYVISRNKGVTEINLKE